MYLLHESCFSDLDQTVGSAARLLDILREYLVPIQDEQAIEALLCRNSFFTTCVAPLLPAEHWSMLFGLSYRRTSPCACVRPSSLPAYALSRRFLTGLSIFENERELRMKNGLNSLIINEVRNPHDDHSGTRIAPLISVCPSHARTR